MNPVSAESEQAQTADMEHALSTVWPNELRTLLLRACVGDGAGANEAWQRFASIAGDPKGFIERDFSGFKGLLPLVHSAARRNGFEIDSRLWTYLRSATLREELRYGAYRDICGRVLGACVDAGLPVIALKASALAETVYDPPAERHCHAIDLLVPSGSLTDVAPIVKPFGFRPAWLAETRPGERLGFRHEFGLPLLIHGNLFDPPVYKFDVDPLWSASLAATIAGAPVRVLSPTYNLLYLLAAAFHDPRRDNLRWACDAWRLLQGRTGEDWSELVRLAQDAGLELPVLTMLRFLAGPLEGPVPDDVLAALAASAGQSRRPTIEAALSAAIGGLSDLKAIWSRRPASPKVRRMVLRFLLWPSAKYLQWRFAVTSRLIFPVCIIYRPVAYAAQRIWWRALRLPGLNRFTRYRRIATELEKLRA